MSKTKIPVFFADYPTQAAIKEGMSQRIIAVDNNFKNERRIYLKISHRLYFKKQQHQCATHCIQYNLNIFVHFNLILKLLKNSEFVYFHSVQNVLPILPCIPFISSAVNLILDIHGIVPEEHYFAKQKAKSRLYSLAESMIFKRLKLALAVTHSMIMHFQKKYPDSSTAYVKFPILPYNIRNAAPFLEMNCSEKNKTNIIYSGNLQAWQNVDLMLNVIKNNLSDDITYTILTRDIEEMKSELQNRDLLSDCRIQVDSVTPDKLGEFYATAHYGFILRDDILVNRVACPTKLIEYMNYGIIPITLLEEIGDFKEMGYEHLPLNQLNFRTLIPKKSKKNIEIINELRAEMLTFDLKSYLAAI